MDRDLNVLQNLSYQDLISYSAAFSNNTAALLGASDDVLILGLDCAVTAAGLAGFAPNNPSPFIGPFSFTDGSLNYASFSVTGNQMGFTVYSNAWGFGSAPGGLISTNPSLNFQLIGVSGDPTRTDVAFILEETTAGQDYYFLIPRAAFPSALLFPLQSNYPWFTTPRSDNRLTAYSQNGFISFQRANNQSGGTFIRLDMAGNTLSDSLRYTDDTDIQIATRIGGGWYYVFNRTTRVLSKITAWWGK
jgi:hypothetical protein